MHACQRSIEVWPENDDLERAAQRFQMADAYLPAFSGAIPLERTVCTELATKLGILDIISGVTPDDKEQRVSHPSQPISYSHHVYPGLSPDTPRLQ